MNPVEYTDQEKRITFQLYNYWFGLADNCGIPPLKSLSPEDIAPYKNNMVLIDLRDPDNEPTLQVVGQLLSQDLDIDLNLKGISDIPRRTLLSRITDHYMEVLGNRTPISFDAEFLNKAREKILYRGILLPFSDDGENINFILGAIRWISEEEKNEAASAPKEEIEQMPLLQDRLEHCRKLVQGQTPTDQRSRRSLYESLGAIFDFHDLCSANPNSYEALLAAAELKKQERAPFTPTLKLCFGRDYDKTRLTEYAAALSFARKNNHDGKSLPDFLDQFPGGIKGCVLAERKERGGHNDNSDKPVIDHREAIDKMPSLASFDLPENIKETIGDDDDLCLFLGRREGARMNIIKVIKNDDKIMLPVLKQIAKDP